MKRAKLYASIYAAIQQIPTGKVATYGQIASLAGYPGYARQVGYALHATPDEIEVPWHRVINAKGEISLGDRSIFGEIQRQMLNAEGVVFNDRGRVNLKKFQWDPKDEMVF
jgi:methylated-DNA-protein-cysteine methyltransferase related protein